MPSLWSNIKATTTSLLDAIEGKPTKDYKLDSSSGPYLGRAYHSTSEHLPLGSSVSLPRSSESSAPKQPQVYIGMEVETPPLMLHKNLDKYVVLRDSDLMDDEKIDAMVGREKGLYWAVKGAIVLLVKDRAECVAEKKRSKEENMDKMIREAVETELLTEKAQQSSKAAEAAKARNPLRSPSVEDFFADSDSDTSVIDFISSKPTLPGPTTFRPITLEDNYYLNPLDFFPKGEMVMLFRRETQELFARKQDGKLYQVVWKVREIHSCSRDIDGDEFRYSDLTFERAEAEIEDMAWEAVDDGRG